MIRRDSTSAPHVQHMRLTQNPGAPDYHGDVDILGDPRGRVSSEAVAV